MKIVYSLVCLVVVMCLPATVRTNITVHHETDTVNYYWFDTGGNYLRQNTLDDEAWLTGYNNVPDNPKTLQERGYDPVNCFAGSPPIPIDPDSPDEVLFSHP